MREEYSSEIAIRSSLLRGSSPELRCSEIMGYKPCSRALEEEEEEEAASFMVLS